MNFKALALGATVGFMAALIPSCGPTNTDNNNDAGVTDGGNTDGGRPPGCGSGYKDECKDGCCDAKGPGGTCNRTSNASPTTCGTNGDVCANCTALQATCDLQTFTCTGGNTTDAGTIGAPCATNNDCAAIQGAVCRKVTPNGGTGTYTNGYCTVEGCDPNTAPCEEGTCIGFDPVLDEEPQALCLRSCTNLNTLGGICRNGYACYGLTSGGQPTGEGICWMYPPPLGPPADKIGNPCVNNNQCNNPPNDGECITELNPEDGGSTGFTDGYCIATCDTDPTHCGDGGVCITFGSGSSAASICLAGCADAGMGQENCRTGYACQVVQGLGQQGFCFPDCNNPGRGCPSGQTCNQQGYCVSP